MSGKPIYLIRAALFVGFCLIYAFSGYTLFRSTAFDYWDILFNADTHRIIDHITAPDVDNYGYSKNHPLFVLFFNPIGAALASVIGSNVVSAILINASVGAAAVPLFQMLLARNGVDNHTACYWALLLGFSGSHMMLGASPESFIFTATALILFCLAAPYAATRPWLLIGVGLLCFGITITNLAITGIIYLRFLAPDEGFFHALRKHFSLYLKQLARFFFSILAIGAVLSVVQTVLYPTSGMFLRPQVHENMKYVYGLEYLRTFDARIFERLLDSAQGFLLYNFLAPKPAVVQDIQLWDWFHMAGVEITFTASSVTDYQWFAYAIILVWLSVLASTTVRYIRSKGRVQGNPSAVNALLDALVACLAFQFLFHVIYGNHPFLYSPHWTFMVLAVAAIVARSMMSCHLQRVVLGFLVVGSAINNAMFMRDVNDYARCLLIDECVELVSSQTR